MDSDHHLTESFPRNSERRLSRIDRGFVLGVGIVAGACAVVVLYFVVGGEERPAEFGWLYEYQNLVAGLLAVAAAAGTIVYLRLQLAAMRVPHLAYEADALSAEYELGERITAALRAIEQAVDLAKLKDEPIDRDGLRDLLDRVFESIHKVTTSNLGPAAAALEQHRFDVIGSLGSVAAELHGIRVLGWRSERVLKDDAKRIVGESFRCVNAWLGAIEQEVRKRRATAPID